MDLARHEGMGKSFLFFFFIFLFLIGGRGSYVQYYGTSWIGQGVQVYRGGGKTRIGPPFSISCAPCHSGRIHIFPHWIGTPFAEYVCTLVSLYTGLLYISFSEGKRLRICRATPEIRGESFDGSGEWEEGIRGAPFPHIQSQRKTSTKIYGWL
jgi:hypothetical protein